MSDTETALSVDEFLGRERQAIEELARELGRDVVNKMDRVLVRDLLYERKVEDLQRNIRC